MKHYSWLFDPQKKDYVVENGDPVQDTTLQFPAYVRLMIQRKKWMYAPDSDYGSDIGQLKKRVPNTWQLLEQMATAALQPMIDDGRADAIDVTWTGSARHEEDLEIKIHDAEGQDQLFTLSPVGL